MNPACGTSIPNPPSTAKTSCAFSYPLNSTASAAAQQCCGQRATITLYDNSCFQYCDVSGDETAMMTCLNNAGVLGACFINRDASAANRISKPALSLTIVIIVYLMVGMMRWPNEQISNMSWRGSDRIDKDIQDGAGGAEKESNNRGFRIRLILIWNGSLHLQNPFSQRGAKEVRSQMFQLASWTTTTTISSSTAGHPLSFTQLNTTLCYSLKS